jgi:hypothetical protein
MTRYEIRLIQRYSDKHIVYDTYKTRVCAKEEYQIILSLASNTEFTKIELVDLVNGSVIKSNEINAK